MNDTCVVEAVVASAAAAQAVEVAASAPGPPLSMVSRRGHTDSWGFCLPLFSAGDGGARGQGSLEGGVVSGTDFILSGRRPDWLRPPRMSSIPLDSPKKSELWRKSAKKVFGLCRRSREKQVTTDSRSILIWVAGFFFNRWFFFIHFFLTFHKVTLRWLLFSVIS